MPSNSASDTRASVNNFFVPDSLKFYVNRLSFSKNRVRLQALSSQVASPNGHIIVVFHPTQCLTWRVLR
jgi:hypothetical protein